MTDIWVKWHLLCAFYVRFDPGILPPEGYFICSSDEQCSCAVSSKLNCQCIKAKVCGQPQCCSVQMGLAGLAAFPQDDQATLTSHVNVKKKLISYCDLKTAVSVA